MKYLPFFEIQLSHTYYTDRRCPDFVIEPTAETERLLKNHRCVIRHYSSGVKMLVSVDDSGYPFLPVPKNAVFLFTLRLQNTDFPLFTNLDHLSDLNAPLFSNEGLSDPEDTELKLVSKTASYDETFSSTAPAQHESFVLSGRPLKGLKLSDFKVTGAGAVQAYDADLGSILVDTRSIAAAKVFTVNYPVMPPLSRGVFAELAIHNNEGLPGEGDSITEPRIFQILFSAKTIRWTYYCVTDLSPSQGAFRITDAGLSEASRLNFSDQNQQDLDQTPDPGDEIAKTLAAQYPQFRKVRFLSDALVPCRQASNPHLEFHVGENKLSESLPNPSFKNNFILSPTEGRSSKEDALFQVIKYVRH